ncbi:unnamed protein product, partial [Effrenium voratum]
LPAMALPCSKPSRRLARGDLRQLGCRVVACLALHGVPWQLLAYKAQLHEDDMPLIFHAPANWNEQPFHCS